MVNGMTLLLICQISYQNNQPNCNRSSH